MTDETVIRTSNERNDPRLSDERNGCFLDKMWCCKVCDGEIPDGHTENCDIWKLEKKHRDFLANEYNAVLTERDQLRAALAARPEGVTSLPACDCPEGENPDFDKHESYCDYRRANDQL